MVSISSMAADSRAAGVIQNFQFENGRTYAAPCSVIEGRHTPRKRSIQYAAASRTNLSGSGILDHPPEPVIGRRDAPTRWRVMTPAPVQINKRILSAK